MEFDLGKKRVRVGPKNAIGKGGEADVYDLGDGRALKLFKREDHPDLAGQPNEQAAARARLLLQQTKLPAFPRALPANVIAPEELALDSHGAIAGYAMRLIQHAEPLLRFGEPAFRRAGATSTQAAQLFRALHQTVSALHAQSVLIGDFNDLNILVQSDAKGAAPFLIDADSFQFGKFPCLAFTERFLDPRLAGKNAQQLVPTLPFDLASDWFAFAALLTQSLLLVGPWAGVHRPAELAKMVPPRRRALERVSIFRSEVQLPRAAMIRESLPDDLLHELSLIFEKDERRPLPRPLLEALAFQVCASCGLEHARAACPACRPHAAAPLKQIAAVHGSLLARTLFETRGAIVASAVDARGLRIVHHDGRGYFREDGRALLTGPRDPSLRFAILGEATLISRHAQLALISAAETSRPLEADLCEGTPVFAAQGDRLVWSSAGRLLSADANELVGARANSALQAPPLVLGELLPQGTRLWLGPDFGLGLTRAGEFTQAFRFAPRRRGLDDSLRLPKMTGRLLRTHCAFASDRVWLFLELQQGLRAIHRCLLLDANGKLLAESDAEAGDGSWLGEFPRACALGPLLFAATDEGLVRIEQRGNKLAESRRFPDTAAFLDAESQLFIGTDSILAVSARCARALSIQ